MRSKLMHSTLLLATLVLAVVGAAVLPASAAPTATHLDFTDSNGPAAGGTPGTITINGTTVNIPGDPNNPGACDLANAHSFLTPSIDDVTGAVTLLTTDYKHAVGTTVFNGLAPGTFRIGTTDYQVQIFGHHDTGGDVDPNPASVTIDVSVVFKDCPGNNTLCTINHVVANLSGTFIPLAAPTLPVVHGDMLVGMAGSAPALAASNFAIGCNIAIRNALIGDVATVNLHLWNNLAPLPH